MSTDDCHSLQALANSLNGLVDAGTISYEHAQNLFAQATSDTTNPNTQPHPDPGAFIAPDPEGFMFGNLRSIGDVYQSGKREIPWLLEGVIPMGAVTLIAAAPIAGKTTMLLSILHAMTTGSDWAGLPVLQGAGWVFTDEGDHSLSEILEDVGPAPGSPHMVFPLSRKGGATFAGICSLVARAVERISKNPNGWTPPKVIVIDTFGSWSGLEDTNNYSEVLKAFKPLQELRDLTGCAVILIHHARKDQTTNGNGPLPLVLGSVGFSAQADHVISLSQWGTGNSRKLQMSGRYRGALKELVVTYTAGEGPHEGRFAAGSESAGRRNSQAETDQQVLALFARGVEYSMSDLLAASDWGEKRLRGAVKRLLEKGELATNDAAANSPKLRYSKGTPEATVSMI